MTDTEKDMREAKSGFEIGKWFYDNRWMEYNGDLPMMLDGYTLGKRKDDITFKARLLFVSQGGKQESKLRNCITRWLILPP